jgi:hypothetical protein
MIKGWPKLVLAFVCSLIASAALGFAFSGPNPQPGQMTFSGFSNGSVAATISGPIPNVNAGQFFGYFDPLSEADSPGAEVDDFLRFFCIDISHYASGGPNPYTRDLLSSLSPTQLTLLTRLFDDDYPNKTQGTYYNGGVTTFGDFVDADHSAAFQLAVWEIFFGDGTNLGSAPFTASSTAVATAQGWLNAINNEQTSPGGWTFYTFTNGYYQTYLSAEYTQPLRTTPEPGSLVLFCVAVLAAWAAAMRRRQTA